jgi:uncharacterized membrane protein (UPF0127 family)
MTLTKNSKIIIVSSCIIGAVLAILVFMTTPQSLAEDFVVNGLPIKLEIASSDLKQYQGLSDRVELCSECGMIFLYQTAEVRTFVMRRMNFPLDIVWIHNKKVVGISENLPPEQTGPYKPYASLVPVDTVLEINAGHAKKYNLRIGENFELKKK